MSIYNYLNYKDYLNEALDAKKETLKGVRSRLAEFIPCHTAYISQVLGGDAHFSLEQSERISQFLGHGEKESYFLLLLIQHERAGSPGLRKVFKSHIDAFLQEQKNLKNRIEFETKISEVDQAEYYSYWYYIAIHALCARDKGVTRDEISTYFQLPLAKVTQVLEFLVSRGLVSYDEGGLLRVGSRSIHVSKGSPLAGRHLAIWRDQAVRRIEVGSDDDLHYSSVICVSKDTATKMREILVKAIDRCRRLVKDSPSDEVYVYSLDLFSQGKG